MALYDAPDGSQFVAPDWLGQTPYDAGAFAPEAQSTTPSMENYYGGLPASVLERIAPGLASPGVSSSVSDQVKPGILNPAILAGVTGAGFEAPEPDVPALQSQLANEVPPESRQLPPPAVSMPGGPSAPAAYPVAPAKPGQATAPAVAPPPGVDLNAQQLANMDAREAIELKQADEALQLANEREAQLREAQEIEIAAREREQELIARRSAEHDEAVERYANSKIDQGRAYSGLGRQIVAGLSVMLSGIGDAIAKKNGPNAAMQIILNAIDKDIDVQMKDRAHLGDVANMRKSRVDDVRRVAADEASVRALMRAGELTRIAAKGDAMAAAHGNPLTKLRWQENRTAFDVAIATNLAQAKAAAEAKAAADAQQKIENNLASSRVGATWFGLKQGAKEFDLTRQDRLADMESKERIAAMQAMAKSRAEEADTKGGVGGVVGIDKDGVPKYDVVRQSDGKPWKPEGPVYKDIVERRTSTQSSIDWMARAKAVREAEGGANKWSSPTAQAEYDQAVANAVTEYAKANGLSTSDQQSINFARDALFGGDPASYTASDVGKRIDRAIVAAEKKFNHFSRSNGYTGKEDFKFVRPDKLPVETDYDAALKTVLTSGINGPGSAPFARFMNESVNGTPEQKTRAMAALKSIAEKAPDSFSRQQAELQRYRVLSGGVERARTAGGQAVNYASKAQADAIQNASKAAQDVQRK